MATEPITVPTLGLLGASSGWLPPSGAMSADAPVAPNTDRPTSTAEPSETIVELRLLTAVFSQSRTVPPAQGAPVLPLTSIT